MQRIDQICSPNGIGTGLLELALDAWKKSTSQSEIVPATQAVSLLLSTTTLVTGLDVYRVDPQSGGLTHVASGPDRHNSSHGGALRAAVKLPGFQLERLTDWVQNDVATSLASLDGAAESAVAPLLAALDPDAVWIGPLHHYSVSGVLVASCRSQSRLSRKDEQLLDMIRDPLAVSLGIDHRWHELVALREAAEADKRVLLKRLERTDLTDRVVGEESGLAQVMRRVDLVSGSDAPVLLLGETGTGKEVIARAIHHRSERHDGPFIRVNCGAIPPELVDSQLFGHEKGAFTGASEQRKGWFERADRGTLFLDEIGELPADAQVRFLRVLQDSIVERIGGGDPIRVDVRVIAATHRDLASMAQNGQFREDLWYRIAVFPILLPPLRDRLGDIPELAEHFAQRAAVRFGLHGVMPSAADLAILQAYNWPGNIRELGSVIDRAAILGEGRTLEIAAALGITPAPKGEPTPPGLPQEVWKPETLDDVARRHIEATLSRTHGTVEGARGAAAILGINPHTLRARMRKLGIQWSRFRHS